MESAYFRQASIGYEIAPRYWGKGYATEAARAMVAFGFGELRLHRIWARCVADNVASYRVLEKVGMRREGCLREEEWIKGRWRDTLVYGILDHEWRSPT
jgi:RimJ/RimL family protein N-acetyltransferase